MEANPQIDATSNNRVLAPGARTSENFLSSDAIFSGYLRDFLTPKAQEYLRAPLQRLGVQAAKVMDELSLIADQQGPELVKRNRFGEAIDQIRFHPAYDELMRIAVESQMMRIKWEPGLRQQFAGERHRMGFAAGYLFAMAESGQYCPLCMTDGVALLLDRFAEDGDKDRLLPRIYTDKAEEFYTGAMFLTEKAGGSDVGANLVRAEPVAGDRYRLYGEKWFCSNVNADIIFALARTDPERTGTSGLSIFLVEKQRANGQRNPLNIVRLKDKLGTRSMASGECLLQGTEAKLIGEEFGGFRIMAQMINLSRLYNSVAALAGGRRALVEAYQFLSFRRTFGKNALEHALVREKLWELGALNLMNFHLVWRAVEALDRAENGEDNEAQLLRLLTPMVKRESAERAVYLARESMELMGGMGYIEDTVLPKIMRDVMVLPIWEGAGNIMLLDMLRALRKSQGLSVMLAEMAEVTDRHPEFAPVVRQMAEEAVAVLRTLKKLPQDEAEFRAKPALLRLTRAYAVSCLLRAIVPENKSQIELALRWLLKDEGPEWELKQPASIAEIRALIGWEF
ncbi:MAG: acyl-CoA dehydrogenase family protein [Bacteroidota bacterium]